MAIYHLSVKIHTRKRSIFGAIAYRTGGVFTEPETGRTYDYTKKTGVVFSKVVLCAGAPEDWRDRKNLWSAVEQKETACDARLAREFEISLPRELSEKDQIALADWYARYLAKQGMCVDYSVHSPDKKGKNHNPHVHMMCTTRPIDAKTGKWTCKEKKEYALDASGNRIPILDAEGKQKIGARGRKLWKRVTVQANPFNDKDKLLEWRQAWEKYANLAFEQRGLDARIDCRSLEDQGSDRLPLLTEGAELRIRERGEEPAKKTHEVNEKIRATNAETEQLNQERESRLKTIEDLKKQVQEEERIAEKRRRAEEEIAKLDMEQVQAEIDKLYDLHISDQILKSSKAQHPEEKRRAEEQAKKEREPTFDDFYAKLPADETYYEDYQRYWMSEKDDEVYKRAHSEVYLKRPVATGERQPVERLYPQFYEVRKDYEDTFLGDLKKLKIKSATLISKVVEKAKSVFSKVSKFFSKDTEETIKKFDELEQTTAIKIKEKQAETAYDTYIAKREREEKARQEQLRREQEERRRAEEQAKKELEEKRRVQKLRQEVDRGEVLFVSVWATRPELKKRIKQHSYISFARKILFKGVQDVFLVSKSELQACADLIQDDDVHFFKTIDDVQGCRELSKSKVCEFAGVAEEFAEKYVCAVVCNNNAPAMMLAKQKAVDYHMCDMEHTEFYISSKELQSCVDLIQDESVEFYDFYHGYRGHQLSRKEVCKLAGVREVKVQAPKRSQGFHM